MSCGSTDLESGRKSGMRSGTGYLARVTVAASLVAVYGALLAAVLGAGELRRCQEPRRCTACTFPALQAAIAAGGVIDFGCSFGTINFASPITVDGGSVTLDASGQSVSFDGGGASRLFIVAGGKLTLVDLALEDAKLTGQFGYVDPGRPGPKDIMAGTATPASTGTLPMRTAPKGRPGGRAPMAARAVTPRTGPRARTGKAERCSWPAVRHSSSPVVSFRTTPRSVALAVPVARVGPVGTGHRRAWRRRR